MKIDIPAKRIMFGKYRGWDLEYVPIEYLQWARINVDMDLKERQIIEDTISKKEQQNWYLR